MIATIPFVMTLAGEDGMTPQFTIGEYTYIMNMLFIGLQRLILRRDFPRMQLFQFIIGFVFVMCLTLIVVCNTILWKVVVQLTVCVLFTVGISLEIRCGSGTMLGVVAVGKATNISFAKAKIIVDITLIVIAVVCGYFYFGTWQWQVVDTETLMSMIIVGVMMKLFDKHLDWSSQ